MNLGEVRIAEDGDFARLKVLADNHDGWKVEYSKGSTWVWSKTTDQSSFKMIKMKTVYKDVKPTILYDVLLDPDYRKMWDTHMLESYDIGCLNPNNDVGYYAMRCAPLKNRDFVLQRSWLDVGKEYLLLNHSVFHETLPPKKGYIRAISYLTGFVVRPYEGNGCELKYVTQCDPRGSLPPWLVNKVTKIFAPKTLKKIHKACLGYEKWKKKHNANYKPWLYPEQMTLPRINLIQCEKRDIDKSSGSLNDESTLDESTCTDMEEPDE